VFDVAQDEGRIENRMAVEQGVDHGGVGGEDAHGAEVPVVEMKTETFPDTGVTCRGVATLAATEKPFGDEDIFSENAASGRWSFHNRSMMDVAVIGAADGDLRGMTIVSDAEYAAVVFAIVGASTDKRIEAGGRFTAEDENTGAAVPLDAHADGKVFGSQAGECGPADGAHGFKPHHAEAGHGMTGNDFGANACGQDATSSCNWNAPVDEEAAAHNADDLHD
jgi:hypothetical protein